jgi:hypothetical protein
MNQKGTEQTAEKITNEVRNVLCGEKINPMKIQWKEGIVIEWGRIKG